MTTATPTKFGTWTEDQREAIENVGQGLSVLAAAGSGKTMVLVQRYLRLLATGLTPKQILTVTFTREAAEQLRTRLLAHTADNPELADQIQSTPYIGTIHSFCLHVLRNHGPEHLQPKEILDDVRWHECFELVFERWFTGLDSNVLRAGLKFWNPQDLESVCKEALRNPFDAKLLATAEEPAERWWAETLPELQRLWDQLVLGFGSFSFADLEQQALLLLRDNTEALQKVRASLGAFLIDEFQDTSPVQWAILEQVIGENWGKAFIVGDPRQSIYGFRNADVRLFFAAQDRIESFGGKTVQLSTCFRSTPSVVGEINKLTARLFEGSPFEGADMVSGRTASLERDGEDCVEDTAAGLARLFYVCDGKKSAELARSEIQHVSGYIAKRIAEGTRPDSIALLFRNSDRIPDYAAALGDVGIRTRFRKGERVFDHYFSWDVLGFLRAVADPLNDFHLTAFLVSPFVGLKWSEILEWQEGTGEFLFDKRGPASDSRLAWFYRLIDSGETSPARAFETLCRNSGYWPAHFPCWEALTKILSTAPSIGAAVTTLELCARNGVLGTSTDTADREPSVSLLTVHAAKGLEFDEVLLVDLLRRSSHPSPWLLTHPELGWGVRYREAGEIAPTARYKAIQVERLARENAEEKRLIYVAVTRARRQITVLLPEDKSLCKSETWGSYFQE